MSTTTQSNGNTQVNSERTNHNQRISQFRILGKTKKVQWDSMRRHRTI